MGSAGLDCVSRRNATYEALTHPLRDSTRNEQPFCCGINPRATSMSIANGNGRTAAALALPLATCSATAGCRCSL
eukprot:2541393-Lingulodinium_polyedra.AAC.1